MENIRIQIMGGFNICRNETEMESLLARSPKGAALMQYLILHRGESVPNSRLVDALWTGACGNPENALKTLVSRLRALLNQISPGLGGCVAADRGAYHWETLPGMTVDLFEIEELLNRLAGDCDRERLTKQLMSLYRSDLQPCANDSEWMLARAAALHSRYLAAVQAYVDFLKRQQRDEEIIAVCRMALDIDSFDDKLQMELMGALIRLRRSSEAQAQYQHAMQLNYRFLGMEPTEELRKFYKQIARAGRTLDDELGALRTELLDDSGERGAFLCDRAVFKEIFNLQARNLERLGANIFLAMIQLGGADGMPMETIRQDTARRTLLDTLRSNLRRGDTITQVSANFTAVLLPGVDFSTGAVVMDRMKRLFYQSCPITGVSFSFRLTPLRGSAPENPAKGA